MKSKGYLSNERRKIVMFEKDWQDVFSKFGWFFNEHSASVVAPADVFLVSGVFDHLVNDTDELRHAFSSLFVLGDFVSEHGHVSHFGRKYVYL